MAAKAFDGALRKHKEGLQVVGRTDVHKSVGEAEAQLCIRYT